jgi:hypothetical protein
MLETFPHPRFIAMGTGDLSDPEHAVAVLDRELPPTALATPQTLVLDLRGKMLSPVSLRRLIMTIGQRVRGGIYGELKFIVLTSHDDIAATINEIALANDLPIFVSRSNSDPRRARTEARPVGVLTESDHETLNEILHAGGSVTVAGLAGVLGIEPTAANNRLVNVTKKQYVFRVKRGRQLGDLFVDPRADLESVFPAARLDAAPARNALLKAGIKSDVYDVRATVAEGEAAERAAEILRRRGKLSDSTQPRGTRKSVRDKS